MTINERVKILRKELKLSQTEFAEKLSVSRDVINNIENNRAELKEHFIKFMCKEFDVNENWLRTGEGEMFKIDRETEIAKLTKQLLKEEENKLYEQNIKFICGIDEAGRGPLAGPVVVGAVILPKDSFIEGVNDSKKVSEKKREILFHSMQIADLLESQKMRF